MGGYSPAGSTCGCYIRDVLEPKRNSNTAMEPLPFWRVLLEHRKWFLAFTLAALALRLLFYFLFPHVTGDSLIYGDIARNWLDHGIFGLTHAEGVRPTWIRLPGYPAFLALCFKLFGREHYHAVLLAQIVIDIAGCFFIADLARRTVSTRAARDRVCAGGAVSLHCELHRRALGRDSQHFLYCRRTRRRGCGVHALRERIVGVEGLDGLRYSSCGWNSTASRRRHSAGGHWIVSAVALCGSSRRSERRSSGRGLLFS